MRFGGIIRGYHMANIVSFGYVMFYPSVRRRCGYYLNRRFPGKRGSIRRLFDVYRLVRAYAESLVDAMVIDLFPGALAATCPDHDQLCKLAEGERGFVLVHAHVGCWQAGVSTLKQFPKNVAIVMLPEARSATLFDPRRSTAIDPRGGLQGTMQMTEALLRGDILVMMGDRSFGNRHSMAPARFLGADVSLPITPFRLASAVGVPVVVMTAPKTGGRSYELRVSKIIDVQPGLGRNSRDYAQYAQRFADCMEEFVRDYPWQFYNFYDMWSVGEPPIAGDREA